MQWNQKAVEKDKIGSLDDRMKNLQRVPERGRKNVALKWG